MLSQITFVALFFILTGCGDSPLYKTPLPNGFEHWSNGGEQGYFSKGSFLVAPYRDHYCNDFGWADHLVVGEVIEYGERAYVDPQIVHGYLMLDTTTGSVTYYDTLDEVRNAWHQRIDKPFPFLQHRHPEREAIW